MLNVECPSAPGADSTFLLISLPPDPRPDRIQPLLDPFVTAVDLVDVADHALAFGAERGEEQSHAGADVGAGDLRAVQPRAADDDGAVRVAEDDARPHLDQLVGKEEARLEHLL